MRDLKEQLLEISQLTNEMDSVYHDIAQRYGIANSVYWILYVLYTCDAPVTQIDLCNSWIYSKQTINSAVTSMIQRDWVTLNAIPGAKNRKQIVLTKCGRQFCCDIIEMTLEIERAAYSKMTNEEMELFIRLFRKNNESMREAYEEKKHLLNRKSDSLL